MTSIEAQPKMTGAARAEDLATDRNLALLRDIVRRYGWLYRIRPQTLAEPFYRLVRPHGGRAIIWAEGVRLFIDGREVARAQATGDYDAALDQLGLAGRVMAPYQVQSRYNFLRGSDFQHIRVYDRMLDVPAVAALARGREPASAGRTPPDCSGRCHRPRSGATPGDPQRLRRTSPPRSRFRRSRY